MSGAVPCSPLSAQQATLSAAVDLAGSCNVRLTLTANDGSKIAANLPAQLAHDFGNLMRNAAIGADRTIHVIEVPHDPN